MIRVVYRDVPPDFPATDQHPDAVRYGPITVNGAVYYADAIGSEPTVDEIAAMVAPVYTCQLWQLQAVLTTDQWAAVQAAVAAMNNPAVTAFASHGTNSIPSNSQTLLALGAAIGLSKDQIVSLVQQASQVSIT